MDKANTSSLDTLRMVAQHPGKGITFDRVCHDNEKKKSLFSAANGSKSEAFIPESLGEYYFRELFSTGRPHKARRSTATMIIGTWLPRQGCLLLVFSAVIHYCCGTFFKITNNTKEVFMYFRLSFLSLLLLIQLFLPIQIQAKSQPIVVKIPEQTIATALKKVLPVQVDTNKVPVKGQITIIDIDKLQIYENGISCNVKLSGQDMAISTNIGDHNINLNVGSLQLHVNANATLRFDAAKQKLYIRPTISELNTGASSSAAELGPTLISLLNGQEFPISLQPLQPLFVHSDSKQVVINTHLANVLAKKDNLQLHLLPSVSAYNKK